jgi:hypothetical protein
MVAFSSSFGTVAEKDDPAALSGSAMPDMQGAP